MNRRRNPDEPARVRLTGFGKPRALRPAVEAFIRDVFDASHPHPFQNDYRTQRVLADIEAVVEVLPEHGGIKIETLRALSRRKGEGTKAMRFLTDLADKHGVELYLYAKPFGDEKMPLDDLVRFYRRFGFRQDEEADEEEDEYEGVEMHRWPREVWPQEAQRTNPSQTETPAFKRWFGRSKAVDARGKPLVVYHGSNATFDTFRRPDISAILADDGASEDEMNQGMGIYFTDNAENAATYGREVYPVYLRMLNPLIVDAQGENWSYVPFRGSFYYADDIVSLAEEKGHDGVVFLNIYDTKSGNDILSNTYIVFDPKQIKSATGNAGTFDPEDPSIYRNPRRRGLDVRPGIPGTYRTQYTTKGGKVRAYPAHGGAAWDRTMTRVASETTVAGGRIYDAVKRAERAGRATVRGKRGAVEVERVTNPRILKKR